MAFDTQAGVWETIDIPFDHFIPVVRNRVNYKGARLPMGSQKDGPKAFSFGIVYSRFEFNKAPNPSFTPGKFTLKIESISAYRNVRPAFVLISSAGAERNAKIENEADRKAEIPIVQLNPGGILNWKYKAETYLRASGLPYTIVRACGLVPEAAYSKDSRYACRQERRKVEVGTNKTYLLFTYSLFTF